MSALTDRIAAVLQAHEIKYEVWSEFSCECGVDGWETYQEWQSHVAAAVAAELQLTEERRTNPMSSAGWSKNWKTGEVTTHCDIRYLRRWVSTWSEVEQ